MSDERERVLKMVEEGTISATEADDLLAALEEGEDVQGDAPPVSPDITFERPWEFPFFGGLVVMVFGLLGLLRSLSRHRRPGLLPRLGAWASFLIGLVVMLAGYWGRDAPWLYVRVHDPGSPEVKISLPLPLFLAEAVLAIARNYVPAGQEEMFGAVAEFIQRLRNDSAAEPFSVQVEEGDTKVLVYIG